MKLHSSLLASSPPPLVRTQPGVDAQGSVAELMEHQDPGAKGQEARTTELSA